MIFRKNNSRKKNKRLTVSYREHGCFRRTAVIFLTAIFELAVKLTVSLAKRIHSN